MTVAEALRGRTIADVRAVDDGEGWVVTLVLDTGTEVRVSHTEPYSYSEYTYGGGYTYWHIGPPATSTELDIT